MQTAECKAVKGIFEYLNGDIEATELFQRWQSVNFPFNKKELADSLQILMTIDVAKMKYYPELNLQHIYQEFLKDLPITDDGRTETEIIFYNLGKFSQIIADYEAINFTQKPKTKLNNFCAFLKYTAVNYYPKGLLANGYNKSDAVSIMTVYQSKGLEYATVFIPRLSKNFFPAQKVGGKNVWHVIQRNWITGSSRFDGDLEDERKLFYVAVTREKKYLFISDLVSVTVAGNVTKFEYDNHYLTEITDPHLTEITDPRGVTVSRNIYDDDGRLIKTIDADGNEINYSHNIDGREEIITDCNGGITQYIYDHNGNVTSQTDPTGNTITNTYDSDGNLSSKTDAMGNITNYSYDENGNMLSLTDAEGNTVTNSYNSKGFVTSINAMGIDIMKVNYDSNGNTSSTIDALGNAINYNYDSKGNLTSVTDEIDTYINVTYDSKGNVTSTTNGVGTTAKFTYDENGNCLTKSLYS